MFHLPVQVYCFHQFRLRQINLQPGKSVAICVVHFCVKQVGIDGTSTLHSILNVRRC